MRYYSLPELVYPGPSRSSRFARTIGVVAIAGAIGALVGGVAAFATMGLEPGSSQRQVIRTATTQKPAAVALNSVPHGLPKATAVAPPKAVVPVPLPPRAADHPVLPVKPVASAPAQPPEIALQNPPPASRALYDRVAPTTPDTEAAHRRARARARVRFHSRRHLARRPLSILPPPYYRAYSEYQDRGWRGGFSDGGDWRY
ncbi:MAG: hypothetical protein ACRECV_08510 [Xanthobacteraceae bacterium]